MTMQHSQPLRPSAKSPVKSRSKFILTLGVLVFGIMITNIIFFIILSSANPPLYFKLETPYLYLLLLSFFIGPVFAIGVWRMANADLKRIHAGLTSPSARGITRVAKLLGVSSTFLNPLIALLGLFLLFTSARTAAVKDAMIQHLIELGTDAHQYRLRSVFLGGGGGSYTGYTMPGHLSLDEYGTYTATAVERDSVRFKAETTLGFPGTISVAIDSTGKPLDAWTFTGHFQF
jgi:hypothetical protein